MYKIGQDIDVGGGNRARIQEDNDGNLFYVHPISKNKNIVVSAREREQLGESLETGERYFDPESYANMNEGSMEGMMRDDNLLTYLMDEEKAHDSINSLIQENEIKNADTPSSPGSRLGGPLATLGEMIAAKLIGQDPETGEIPTQPYPYNPLMNLLNLPPGNQMKTGGPPFAQVSTIKEIMKLLK